MNRLNQKSLSTTYWLVLFFLVPTTLMQGCDDQVQCEPGEIRFVGRPPARLFIHDESCREDCFSFPTDDAEPCDRVCEQVRVNAAGSVTSGTDLRLIDTTSLGNDLALVYTFGPRDGAKVPEAMHLINQSPRTYDAKHGTDFEMMAQVWQFRSEGSAIVLEQLIGGENNLAQLVATPGRLELWETGERFRGYFDMVFDSPLGQPQSNVHGCFDLGVSSNVEIDAFGEPVQALAN